MNVRMLLMAVSLLVSANVFADGTLPPDSAKIWQHVAPEDGIQGVSTQQAYEFLRANGRKSTPIVVAIIDSGTDIEHEDLKGSKWVNKDEIAGNGIDDDNNGFIDDIHGWNFIGGKDGRNIEAANMELTRIYRGLAKKFDGKKISKIKPEEKQEHLKYLAYKKKFEKKIEDAKAEYNMVMQIWMADSLIGAALGKEDYTEDDLRSFKSRDERLQTLAGHMYAMFQNGLSRDEIKDYKKYVDTKMQCQLNPKFDPRPEIIGDDPLDAKHMDYGNNDVIGKSADHGTHVAGIVAATRGNGIGMDGIADNVKLMILRTIPDGDERDKDVANAIKYAVNNGAKIINMSFGKSTTTLKSAVDEAIAYAEEKGVLLIHAAGNDGINIDVKPNFPTPVIEGRKKPMLTWLTVGASGARADSTIVASFSNYGKEMVDIFAPGVDVYSTYPNNKYKKNSGTSMAAPVVTGVAALVWSYYPTLTAIQVKKILLKSSVKHKKLKVTRPISAEEKEGLNYKGEKRLKFKKLSNTGGVVNAFRAVKRAHRKAK